jgi:hypothetical protein
MCAFIRRRQWGTPGRLWLFGRWHLQEPLQIVQLALLALQKAGALAFLALLLLIADCLLLDVGLGSPDTVFEVLTPPGILFLTDATLVLLDIPSNTGGFRRRLGDLVAELFQLTRQQLDVLLLDLHALQDELRLRPDGSYSLNSQTELTDFRQQRLERHVIGARARLRQRSAVETH